MEKRLFLAVVVSVGIMLIWSLVFQSPNKPVNIDKKAEENINNPNEILKERFVDENSISQTSTLEEISGEKKIISANDVELENQVLKLVFSNRGGVVKKIILKDYKDQENKDINLIDLNNSDIFSPLGIFFEDARLNMELNLGIWDIETEKYSDGTGLIFTYTTKISPIIKFNKKFILKNNSYLVSANINISNVDNNTFIVPAYKSVWEPMLIDTETGKKENSIITCIAGKVKHIKNSDVEKSEIFPIENQSNHYWISTANKYFVITMIPGIANKTLLLNKNGEGANTFYNIGIGASEKSLNPGKSSEEKFDIYMGPKNYEILTSFEKGLEENIDFGFFGGMSKGLLVILKYLNKLVNNYGVAIIIITVILKVLFMPLTEKSFVSMKKLHSIQPEIDALKQKYKNDTQRFNAEVMKLYKDRKINPFGGCLPILAQIPIFWALFNALNNAIELRHAPFMLWIKDLSKPDTIIHFGTIGLNILPILMLVSMVVQQRMTTNKNTNASNEEKLQQKLLLYGMPIIFGVMFYNMPSGLVLYWFLNNVLSIIHQYFINKKLTLQN